VSPVRAGGLPERWLVVRLSALGDVVLATGLLEHLHRTLGWEFHFLTRPAFAPALQGLPSVRRLVLPEPGALRGAQWLKACRDLAARHEGFGLLDLHGTLRSRALGALWHGPVLRAPKLALARRLFGLTRAQRLGAYLERTNVPQRYALAALDQAPPRKALRPVIHLSEAELAYGRDLVAGLGDGVPVCALHPYATHAGKRWPTGHWHSLAQRLGMVGWKTVVVGRHKEPLFAVAPPEGTTDLTNATDIRQTCAILSQCQALVTGDSGPMHLGTAVGTRVVALFGPTVRAWGFAPSGPHDVVLEAALPCRPCSLHGGRGCRRAERCMRDIDPDAVARAVLERPPASD